MTVHSIQQKISLIIIEAKIRNDTMKKKKRKYIISTKNVTYAKKDLVLMITIKNIIKSEIIVITLEDTEVLLMISAI